MLRTIARVPMLLTVLAGLGALPVACGGEVYGVGGDGGGGGGGGGGGSGIPPGDGSATFTTALAYGAITKVDLLFDIDNSASMGDKQFYLEQAVPDLVNRLVNPNCILPSSGVSQGSSNGGSCSAFPGSVVEFPPVSDMHIGIISTSLGTRGVNNGGQVCDPNNPSENVTPPFLDGMPGIPTHVDDRGELLNRTATGPEQESVSPDVGAQNFLDWFPSVPANAGKMATVNPVLTPPATPLTSTTTLESDFAQLITGVHFYGCGIESQIETWYRFLIQPDPYDSISTAGGQAKWVGVDKTIIQQRHDFLRPDSLVAIISLSDENDSEIDVRSFGGQGFSFMDEGPPAGEFQPPRGTSACLTDPASPDCTSCAYSTATTRNDPNCKKGPYTNENDWGFYINVRHVHMVQKYGIDPQFPLQRYVLGLTSAEVPDRDHEYPPGALTYHGGTAGDPDDLNCQNPLFAASLPDGTDLSPATLCNTGAGAGPRTPNQVFYAHIGGVPHQLIQTTPGETDAQGNVLCAATTPAQDCPQKDTLNVADWTKILGQGPATGGSPYDYTGIDPHMIENYDPPRTGTAYNTGETETIPAGDPSPSGGGPDPMNGRDWTTDSVNPSHGLPVDREYACIFPLPTPRDCSKGNSDPVDSYACDCEPPTTGGQWYRAPNQGVIPPVCGLTDPASPASPTNDYTTQYYGKTYPTIRELTLAELLGFQGIVSSICPIHTTEQVTDDPLYGYRPAINSILGRLRSAFTGGCLPQPLPVTTTPSGPEATCVVLATLPNTASVSEASVCAAHPGLSVPPSSLLEAFNATQHAEWATNMSGVDPSTEVTCEVTQIPTTTTCVGGASAGWCYVTGLNAGSCDTQAILFTPNVIPNGALVNLQCTR
jgi:hypothetical protein